MCKRSESITGLAKALVKFNGEVSKIDKDSTNPHFKNKYASLDNIIDEVRPILTKHGLSIIQMPGGDGEKFSLTTMLLHESGEWIESDSLVMRPVKNDPQGIGSCTTYARRYGIAAFLNLNTGEDDDGNNASQSAGGSPSSAPKTDDKPSAPIKAKYQIWRGSIDGFEDWYAAQKEKFKDAQIDHWLTTQVTKKDKGTAV